MFTKASKAILAAIGLADAVQAQTILGVSVFSRHGDREFGSPVIALGRLLKVHPFP